MSSYCTVTGHDQHHHYAAASLTRQSFTSKAGQGQDIAVVAGLGRNRVAQVPAKYPRRTTFNCRCCGLFYGLLLVLVVSTTSAQTPSLINQDCRPCSHQNSEPPSIERHRHLIFFSCQLLLESSPSLPGSRHSSFSFFYFVPSIPVHLFLFHCPIHALGLAGFDGIDLCYFSSLLG